MFLHKQKRAKVHTSTADVQPSKANVATDGENDGRTSSRREQSPTQEEREETFDDLDEPPPKVKRNRPTTQGPDQPLIGMFTHGLSLSKPGLHVFLLLPFSNN